MSILAFNNNNYKIVYINGLKCPEERAEGAASRMSSALKTKVKLFWNPLMLTDILDSKTLKFQALVERLSEKIKKYLNRGLNVCLVPHSKGCQMVLTALNA